MFSRVLGDSQQIPVAQSNRRYTDCICCVVSSLFAITLFVLAIIAFTGSASDDSHYFNRPEIFIADLSSPHLSNHNFKGLLATLFWASILSLGLGLLWLTIVHLVPMHAPKIAILLAFLACVVVAVFAFLVQNRVFGNHGWLRYVFAGIVIFVAIVLLAYFLLYSNEHRVQGLFLQYAVRFLNERPANFFYILLFLLLTCGLTALCAFQHVAFSRKQHSNKNFFDFSNPGALGILNIIEFLWGLKFLQDAFIFIVSGNAVDYYWRADGYAHPCLGLSNLLLHNWGSVVAGSLINLLFTVPCLLVELLICHPTGCCNKAGNLCYGSCGHYILNLVRTDSYAFTNVFGTAYCDSSRNCNNLCLDYVHFQGSQSPMRNCRIVVQIFLTAAGLIGSYFVLNHRVDSISVWLAMELVVAITAVTYYFGSLHTSAAEGLQTSFMVEHQLEGEYDYMLRCLPSVRNEMKILSRRAKRDGNC